MGNNYYRHLYDKNWPMYNNYNPIGTFLGRQLWVEKSLQEFYNEVPVLR